MASSFLAAPPPGESPAPAELDRYEQIFRGIAPEPHPVFELAFRWLRARLPPAARRALVHGDYRIGNVIFGPEGVRAILDWELAHVGDPAEDLGWLCVRAWRFGSDDKPVGGIGTREELFAAYERAGGGAGRSAARALLGGVRQPQVGDHLHHAGEDPPRRPGAQRRAGGDRPAHGGDRDRAARI